MLRTMAELIVALDVSSATEVDRVVDTLGSSVSFYKVGLELFVAEGPDVVRRVTGRGKRVFLDLKLHDIPRTVERAVTCAAAIGVDLLTIHAGGGRAMVTAAAAAAARCGRRRPRILAVTALTSLDQTDLNDLGVQRTMALHVSGLARLAVGAGADGIVCSPQEVAAMSAALPPGALLVTPGIRPAGGSAGDQKRVATPASAVAAGATHLVVGRPILEAVDPAAAAAAITAEMRQP